MSVDPIRAIAIAGNPNSGKSAFFNLLTGAQQQVANFPGVTVEKKIGYIKQSGDQKIKVIDLPGTYSIDADSPDELIAQEIILGLRTDTEKPDTVLVVVDATHLERSLFLISQLMEFGLRMILCLNMFDVAKKRGIVFDLAGGAAALGMPIVPTVAITGEGKQEILKLLDQGTVMHVSHRPFRLAPETEALRARIADRIESRLKIARAHCDFWAGKILSERWRLFKGAVPQGLAPIAQEFAATIQQFKNRFEIIKEEVQARHVWSQMICKKIITARPAQVSLSDRLDRYALHPVLGPILFLAIMLTLFQAVFSWVGPLADGIEAMVGWLGNQVGTFVAPGVAPGWLRDLLVDGVIGGVGSVVVFVPQIMILFLFIGLLESSGYMSRAAYLVDRLMVHSGLSGKSFIPLLSSFACAVPGIMAARTIKNEKDRLATILVAPLMACSARLPVYTLLIAAFVPSTTFFGVEVQGLTMLLLYLVGIVGAVVAAKVMRKTLLKGGRQMLVLELPDYKVPRLRNLGIYMWQRLKLFLVRVGKIILVTSMLLWFLVSFPKAPPGVESRSEAMHYSYAGKLGKTIEPLIAPLGFDWKVGVALIASFAAREVFVATMATLYNVAEDQADSVALQTALREDRNQQGKPIFTPPMVAALLVFFVFAMQCLSTLAVIKRETNSWGWAGFALVYTYLLAYGLAWCAYRGVGWLS